MNTKMVVCVLLLLSVVAAGATTTLTSTHIFTPTVSADTVSELTSGVGVTIDGVLIKDSEMAVSYVGDMETQSFHNVLVNGDFESWSAGTSASPDGWSVGGSGATIARESTTIKSGTYSTKMTYGAGTATMYNLNYNTAGFYNYYKSKPVTFDLWVWCDTSNLAVVRIGDGVGTSYSDYHTGGSGWELLSVTRTISPSATKIATELQVVNTGSAYFDGAICVEGSVCPAFSPKTIYDDGVMLNSHTPSSASSSGVAGQWCYDTSYIYVCTTDDTWKRAAISTW